MEIFFRQAIDVKYHLMLTVSRRSFSPFTNDNHNELNDLFCHMLFILHIELNISRKAAHGHNNEHVIKFNAYRYSGNGTLLSDTRTPPREVLIFLLFSES